MFKWADNQKAIQMATMHTLAFLSMQRRLRLKRGSPTAPTTPMVLRLEHQTLFFDEKRAQFVPLSSTITARMESDPTAASSLAGETTAQRSGWIAHVPRHRVHGIRRRRRSGNSLEVPTARPALPSMEPIRETEGTSHTLSTTCTTCTTSRIIHGHGVVITCRAWPLTCLVQVNKGRCITHPRNQRWSVAVGTAASMRKHRRQ